MVNGFYIAVGQGVTSFVVIGAVIWLASVSNKFKCAVEMSFLLAWVIAIFLATGWALLYNHLPKHNYVAVGFTLAIAAFMYAPWHYIGLPALIQSIKSFKRGY